MHKYKTKTRMMITSQNLGCMHLVKKSEHGNADIENQENEEIHIQNDLNAEDNNNEEIHQEIRECNLELTGEDL